MRREAFKFWDLVRLILDTLRYLLLAIGGPERYSLLPFWQSITWKIVTNNIHMEVIVGLYFIYFSLLLYSPSCNSGRVMTESVSLLWQTGWSLTYLTRGWLEHNMVTNIYLFARLAQEGGKTTRNRDPVHNDFSQFNNIKIENCLYVFIRWQWRDTRTRRAAWCGPEDDPFWLHFHCCFNGRSVLPFENVIGKTDIYITNICRFGVEILLPRSLDVTMCILKLCW